MVGSRNNDLSYALEVSERRRKESQRLSGVGFWELNHQAKTLYWSEEIFAIYELDPEQVEPNYDIFLSLIYEEDLERVHNAYQASVNQRTEYNIRYRVKAGGDAKWIEARGVTYYDGSDKPIRTIGTAQDISEIVDAQQQIEKSVKEKEALIQKVRDRAEEAEQANNAKSEFLAAMSHDLRTPLNAIVGFSEIMQERIFGPLGDKRYEEYVGYIHDSGVMLVSLINDILDLSKIEANKYVINDVPIKIEKLVSESVAQNLVALNSKKQKVRVRIGNDMPFLKADRRAVLQILNNLISNSIKFASDDYGITVQAEIDDTGHYLVAVSDKGPGISPEDLKTIAEPFMQSSAYHSRPAKGTGLGLCIVDRLMKLHNGTMRIESQLNVGTTVILKFPKDRVVHSVSS
jgi:PAS domain S-box-containing protein